MNKLLILISCLLLSSCAVSRKVHDDEIKVKFLDEYVLPSNIEIENTQVGGLSGIDRKNGQYYLVCDQASNPRIYTANIEIKNNRIDTVSLKEMMPVKAAGDHSGEVLDLEAIRVAANGDLFITSEGMINDSGDPGVYRISPSGKIQEAYSLPSYFKASGDQKPRSNGVFEGLSESYGGDAYWVATELPLEKDGPKPKLYPTRSHVRFTKFDRETGEALRQFAYKLDGIAKLPINFFAVNGVTEILEYQKNKFLVLERAYSAGYGSHGNTVKVFAVDASKASNTLEMHKLKGEDYQLADKKLIFNFKSVKDRLTDKIIDNIEGMCFGPELPNGTPSLILVSDNNFNSFAEQINQFILLELDFLDAEL